MKIPSRSTAALPAGQPSNPIQKGSVEFSEKFADVLEGLPGAKAYDEILKLEKNIERAGELSAKELIQYQIKVSRFGLQVELASKVAEGGLSAMRRLQSNQ